MKARLQRQVAIRNVINQNTVTSQEQLLMLLKRKGFEMTQATLSRDIKALKIIKTPDSFGKYIYMLPKDMNPIENIGLREEAKYLADGFVSIDFSSNIAVVKTRPAFASSIASLIDGVKSFEILGTIAGDDTIFLVLREGVEREDVIYFLEEIMPNIKGKIV
ncbi:MAG: ArgR family transcriptional regulator [Prolixibacteraceae bacterium]|nr:ArgR family transcriptional regulator [Prolixibacteraceae bacterium]